MQIKVSFIRFLKRNSKTGEAVFSARLENNKYITCTGECYDYIRNTPLLLSGKFESDITFIFTDVSFVFFSENATKHFLCDSVFSGIGGATAEKIIKSVGYDLNVVEKIPFTDEATSNLIVSYCELFRLFEKCYGFLKKYNGTYYDAVSAYTQCGAYIENTLNGNPYRLLRAGLKYDIIEKIAHDNEIEMCDKERLKEIVRYSVNASRQNGNTYISFKDLCATVSFFETKAGSLYDTSPLFIAEEVMGKDYVYEVKNEEINIYKANDYCNENLIVENIDRLIKTKKPVCKGINDDDIEKQCGIKFSDEQKRILTSVEEGGIVLITGGPGTGKTTIINGIIKKCLAGNPRCKITLCAPTACAANRMAKATGLQAFTFHKILNLTPGIMDLLQVHKLDADVLIADEMSMCDTTLFATLLTAVKNGCMVYLCGDKDQLPSIGPGNVFCDLLETKVFPTYSLNKIYRQEDNSVIIENSSLVNKGNKNLKTADNFIIKRFNTEDDVVNEALKYAKYYSDNEKEFMLFTPSKKPVFKSGSISMNRNIQRFLLKDNDDNITYGYNVFHKGDKVIFTVNNYDKGYYNGQEGVVINVQAHTGACYMTVVSEGERIVLCGKDLEDVDLGYALTAHKAQGNECDNAIIVVPKKPSVLLKRKLLYVEITRARKNVVILSEQNAIDTCISNWGEKERKTGLKEKMLNCYSAQSA